MADLQEQLRDHNTKIASVSDDLERLKQSHKEDMNELGKSITAATSAAASSCPSPAASSADTPARRWGTLQYSIGAPPQEGSRQQAASPQQQQQAQQLLQQQHSRPRRATDILFRGWGPLGSDPKAKIDRVEYLRLARTIDGYLEPYKGRCLIPAPFALPWQLSAQPVPAQGEDPRNLGELLKQAIGVGVDKVKLLIIGEITPVAEWKWLEAADDVGKQQERPDIDQGNSRKKRRRRKPEKVDDGDEDAGGPNEPEDNEDDRQMEDTLENGGAMDPPAEAAE